MLIFFFFFKNFKIQFFYKVFKVSLLRWRLTLTSLISLIIWLLFFGFASWYLSTNTEMAMLSRDGECVAEKYNFPFYDSCTKKWDNIPVSIDIVGHIKYVMPHILFGSPKKIWHFIINYQRDTYCLFFCLARDPSAQREGASILNRTIKCSSSAASPL